MKKTERLEARLDPATRAWIMQAAAFHRRHDFHSTRDSRLVMKVATARAALHRD